MKRKFRYTIIGSLVAFVLLTTACQKEYYFNSGLSKPNFDGSMMEYLESKPVIFDTLVQVIKLAGMESYFRDSNFTFFAPADSSIHLTINDFNSRLKNMGQDTISSLGSVNPEFWRATLLNYMYRNVKGLEDYPQLDINNKQAFPGEFSRSMGGRVTNIGGVFTSARGIKYQGYRYLNISYVPSESAPFNSWILARVATCNIKPKNGMIHVLAYATDPDVKFDGISYATHYFGFNIADAWTLAQYYGFNKQTN